MRGSFVTLAAAIVLLGTAAGASGGAQRGTHGRILGVVPHAGAAWVSNALGALGLSSPSDLVYQGGPVMHSSTTYAIYWFPSGFTLDPTYENTINQYFIDVAAASGGVDNVYSAATQYFDAGGPISYQSTFGGAIVDTSAFPPNGCSDGRDRVCLSDAQLQTELQNVLTARGLHGGLTNMYFLITPNGVGSCFDAGECSTNKFCAYHSDFFDSAGEDVIYANEPFEGPSAGCTDPSQGFPNNQDADTTINTISHEHNEAITDPDGNAWLAENGEENGDLCLKNFGAIIGGTPGVDAFNQVINGHHYDLQQEYSNDGSRCVQRYLGVPVNFASPSVSGSAIVGHVLSATTGTWSQSPGSFTYTWLRCASTSASTCSPIAGGTRATYQLAAADGGKVLRIGVTATNAAGSSSLAESTPTAVVVPVPSATVPPTLSGVPAVGKVLKVKPGSWNTPATFTYQWLRCSAKGTSCVPVGGATGTDFFMLGEDAGHTFEVAVTATNAAGSTQALTKRSALVVSVPHLKRAPRITGLMRVGRRVVVSHGTWSGPPKSYRYQWLRCNSRGGGCRSIHHATHSTYRLGRSDFRHRLRARVTAVNAAGKKLTTSRSSARVSF